MLNVLLRLIDCGLINANRSIFSVYLLKIDPIRSNMVNNHQINMNKLLNILILVVALSSCTLKERGSDTTVYYNASLPAKLYSFFGDYECSFTRPDFVYNTVRSGEASHSRYFKVLYLIKYYKYNNEGIINSIRDRLNEDNAELINLSGEHFFALESTYDMLFRYDSIQIKEIYNGAKDLPIIPSFKSVSKFSKFFSHPTLSGLSDDSELYIVKSGNEFFLPKKYDYEWELMPEGRRHGYSGGVILNQTQKVVVLWAMAW